MKLKRRIEIGVLSCFIASILLHFLLLLSAAVVFFTPASSDEPPPELEIKSYLAKNETPPAVETKPQPPIPQQKPQEPDKNSISLAKPKPHSAPQNLTNANTVDIIKNETPVHLIGEKNVAAPLLTLLGKALSKHLEYPKIAVDFYIRGRAVVGFLLHEDGRITDVVLVESSKAGVLDDEAVQAVTAMSPVAGVGEYVHGEKYLTVGVIFG